MTASSISLAAAETEWPRRLVNLLPGVAACVVMGLVATRLAPALTGNRIDAVTFALGLGIVLRVFVRVPTVLQPGVAFTAKNVLEVITCALGAAIGLSDMGRMGVTGALSIAAVVVLGLLVGFAVARAAGLPASHAAVVACGNAICGNSAILAVAPVVDAKREEVASAMAVTAVLGAVLVLLLPLWQGVMGLDSRQFGAVAGLTVYAVPQVLAATIPVGADATAVGTLVKLTRVALLGPVIVVLGYIWSRRKRSGPHAETRRRAWFPWYVTGFLILATARSTHLLPGAVGDLAASGTRTAMPACMAALGLQVDLRSLRQVGTRISLTVITMLLLLLALSFVVIELGKGTWVR